MAFGRDGEDARLALDIAEMKDEISTLKSEIERLNKDRATQLLLLTGAHKLLQDAGIPCGTNDYLRAYHEAEDRKIIND